MDFLLPMSATLLLLGAGAALGWLARMLLIERLENKVRSFIDYAVDRVATSGKFKHNIEIGVPFPVEVVKFPVIPVCTSVTTTGGLACSEEEAAKIKAVMERIDRAPDGKFRRRYK